MTRSNILLREININSNQIIKGENLITSIENIIDLGQKTILIDTQDYICDGLFVAITTICKNSKIEKVEAHLKELNKDIKDFLNVIEAQDTVIVLNFRKDLNINIKYILKDIDMIFKNIVVNDKFELLEKELYKIEDEMLGVLNILREREKVLKGSN